ncbi:hypothetical protein DYB30_004201 [Aphanomyces astaci]|uniref:Elongation factor Tu, chloroplastic n=1 Tax=Aphanomyces astaci TaxID=112090 RepID=A0A397CDF6_APHAT|nr:hypothetical protein DYB30_004201 [Aphanomyces astaci]
MEGAMNVNVGILGHVGGREVRPSRSTMLDVNSTSGITLDLGFSSFLLPLHDDASSDAAQITLVDCPGHASLIKTVIGGAHIIDMALLVIDVVKGIQMQTIESMVLAELSTPHVLVVLNKVDLLPDATRPAQIAAMTKTIRDFLSTSPTLHAVPIVPVSSGDADGTRPPLGMPALLAAMRSNLHVPARSADGPLVYAVDHCFPLRGKGTVLTGTVLSGQLRVNDTIALPMLGVEKKVKSLQMFHASVDKAIQGDRVAIRVHGLDASAMERGLAITPHSLSFSSNLVLRVHQIRFFSLPCASGTKVHVTVGHTTVMAKATYFYHKTHVASTSTSTTASTSPPPPTFDPSVEYSYLAVLDPLTCSDQAEISTPRVVFVLLQLDREVLCPPRSHVVCSRLDTDVNKHVCRIAFHGLVDAAIENVATSIRIGKVKERRGGVDKTLDDPTVVIVKDLFRKETNWDVFRGLRVQNVRTKCVGQLDGPFGKAGKVRAVFPKDDVAVPGDVVVLRFTKILFQDKHDRSLGQSPTIYNDQEGSATTFNEDKGLTGGNKSEGGSTSAALLASVECEKKCRTGLVERLKGETAANGSNPSVIAAGLFATAEEAVEFIGAQVATDAAEVGYVEALFGKAGKVRVVFPDGGTLAKVGQTLRLFEK